MRKTLMMSAAALCLAAAAAQAQQVGAGATVGNSSGMTQSPPQGGTPSRVPPAMPMPMAAPMTSPAPMATAPMSPAPMSPAPMAAAPKAMDSGAPEMKHGRRAAMHGKGRAGMQGQDVAATESDSSAPPTAAYRGGAGSPTSTQASNTTARNTRSEIAPRLPDPNAASNAPEAYLAAAQRALNQGRTGAAQEALERAETRILSRSTDPSMAGQPDSGMMVQHIGEARRALADRNTSAAKSAISMAMAAPASAPMAQPMSQPQPMLGNPPMTAPRTY